MQGMMITVGLLALLQHCFPKVLHLGQNKTNKQTKTGKKIKGLS